MRRCSGVGVDIDRTAEQVHVAIFALAAAARDADDERRLDIGLTGEGRDLRSRALDVPVQIMARVGMDAAQIAQLRDGLAPFAGRRPDL